MDIKELCVLELSAMLQSKQISATELTKYYLKRIKTHNKELNALTEVSEEYALKRAEEIDNKRAKNEELPNMAGIPFISKEVISDKYTKTNAGSKILENYQAPYNATVIQNLEKEGYILLGKSNTDEFAMGSSTENSAYGVTRNPWDKTRVPGGSSGGAASAVSARLAPLTLGTDTGGSIRQPASFCGITGIKPSYGRVSRYGVIAYASSLDQVGCFGGSAKDVAYMLQSIAKYDKLDSTSAKLEAIDYIEHMDKNANSKKYTVGLIKEFQDDPIDPIIKQRFNEAIQKLNELGHNVVEISIPRIKLAIPAYYVIANAEASANLARYDGVEFGIQSEERDSIQDLYRNTRSQGFGEETKRRILLGTYVLSAKYYDAYYTKAVKIRNLIKQDVDKAFNKCDVIVSLSAPTTAFEIGSKTKDPINMYLSDVYTVGVNLVGCCGLSIPCGFDDNNLPVGLQFIGKSFREEEILTLAHSFQLNTSFHTTMPNID